jgi:hypothetical protein
MSSYRIAEMKVTKKPLERRPTLRYRYEAGVLLEEKAQYLLTQFVGD